MEGYKPQDFSFFHRSEKLVQQSKQDKEFVMKNGSLEFEVFADIVKTAEDIPYIGSLFKLGRVALNYMDYCFVRKLHYFLAESESLEP